jgi:hypothetical protein
MKLLKIPFSAEIKDAKMFDILFTFFLFYISSLKRMRKGGRVREMQQLARSH